MNDVKILLLILFAPFLLYFLFRYLCFKLSPYGRDSGNSYFRTLYNKGTNGEYQTAKELYKIKGYKRLLYNVYLPTQRSSRTEVDIIMLHKKGIFVIENKNYSGWIFGRQEDKNWCQTFGPNKKYFFYNPIKQNETHLRCLKRCLKGFDLDQEFFVSVISFNSSAVLKQIKVQDQEIIVVNTNKIYHSCNKTARASKLRISEKEIDMIYNHLKNYMNVSRQVKKEHIRTVTRASQHN